MPARRPASPTNSPFTSAAAVAAGAAAGVWVTWDEEAVPPQAARSRMTATMRTGLVLRSVTAISPSGQGASQRGTPALQRDCSAGRQASSVPADRRVRLGLPWRRADEEGGYGRGVVRDRGCSQLQRRSLR